MYKHKLACFFYSFFIFNSTTSVLLAAVPIPEQAKEQGYLENTFSSNFLINDIDIEDTRNSGYAWYVGKFFGWNATPRNNFLFHNKYLTITSSESNNFSIATATRVKEAQKWVGQAFGGGGYFEADIRFDPDEVIVSTSGGWPSFWAMAIEHMANLPEEQWTGQDDGFVHFIEVDIMEYLIKDPLNKQIYGANIHDWFGVWKKTCSPKQFCGHSIPYLNVKKKVPDKIDLGKFHKYGFLWVPATSDTQGWGQFYFDNKPIGSKTVWSLYNGQTTSMSKSSWTFGILDKQHIVLIFGTGKNLSMDIRSARVWQKSNENNWIQ